MNKTILIVGGGTAGWMTAGYYSKKGYAVTLVESPEVGIVGVGESTLPAMNWFAQELGMEEQEWMPMCDSVFKLAIKHEDWNHEGSNWWHWFVYDRTQTQQHLDHLNNNTLPPQDKYEYGYHVDAYKFGDTIAKTVALKHGCQHIVAHVTEVIGNEVTGIERVITREGHNLTADFYIDCTGWKKLLANKVGMVYSQYEHLVNDRAIAAPQPSLPTVNRYTTTMAKSSGWIWEIPLTTRRGTGYVYSSKFISDQDALSEYCEHYPNTDVSTVNYLKFRPEVCLNPVHLNVAVIGLSGGFIEPLEATSLYLTQYMILQSKLFVSGERTSVVVNRNLKKLFDNVAKFVLYHYTLSGRTNTEYWRYYNELEKNLNTLDSIKEYAAEKDIPYGQSATFFLPFNWWCMADGYNII